MKKLQRGKWLLTHERYIDDMGFEVDSFDLFDTEQRVHRPFWGTSKVSTADKNFPINKIAYNYTEEDYEAMLDEQVSRIKTKPTD